MEKTHPPEQGAQGASNTPASLTSSPVVYLNVGGQRFVTRLDTLRARGPNFLSALVENALSGRLATPKDPDGYLVLDRSPQLFALVLDYLRSGYMPPVSHYLRDQLERELDFFQIKRDHLESASESDDQAEKLTIEIKDQIASSVSKWKAKANAFVQAHGEFLMTKFMAELDAGYDTLKESYPAQNGQVNVGAESIALFRNTQSLYLRFISEILQERYGVIARWKSYSSSLVLLIQHGPQHELLQDIRDMLEASFEPHGRRLRVHQCYDLNEERKHTEKKRK